jgi:excisionase family DNA binding protein
MHTMLTAKEAAEYLKVKLSTIRKWTHLGFIPYVKLRGAVRYDQAKIDEWIEKRSKEGRTKLKASSYEANPKLTRRDATKPVKFDLD